MSTPFMTQTKVCPKCYSPEFVSIDKTKYPHTPFLTRYFCHHCRSYFRTPKEKELVTSNARATTNQRYENVNVTKSHSIGHRILDSIFLPRTHKRRH